MEKDGEFYMTHHDFTNHYLGLFENDDYLDSSVHLLANCADTTKNGYEAILKFQINQFSHASYNYMVDALCYDSVCVAFTISLAVGPSLCTRQCFVFVLCLD